MRARSAFHTAAPADAGAGRAVGQRAHPARDPPRPAHRRARAGDRRVSCARPAETVGPQHPAGQEGRGLRGGDRHTGAGRRPTSSPTCWKEVIRSFPWPRSMRWGTSTLRWVGPLHSVLLHPERRVRRRGGAAGAGGHPRGRRDPGPSLHVSGAVFGKPASRITRPSSSAPR